MRYMDIPENVGLCSLIWVPLTEEQFAELAAGQVVRMLIPEEAPAEGVHVEPLYVMIRPPRRRALET